MKKIYIYLIGLLFALLMVCVFFLTRKPKEFDKTITLSRKESRPYGTQLFFKSLPALTQNASIEVNKKNITDRDIEKIDTAKKQLLFIITKQFYPTKAQLHWLYNFIAKGNNVIISATEYNSYAEDFFKARHVANYPFIENELQFTDSNKLALVPPKFETDSSFKTIGYNCNGYFHSLDTSVYTVLGTNADDAPNFLKASVGSGSVYLHSNPFVFTNYFLLQNKNTHYVAKMFALLPPNTSSIIWDEYFLTHKHQKPESKKSIYRVLLKFAAFRWALGVVATLFLIYFFIHIKRRERYMDVQKPLQNESLDFANTIGKLYFQNGDHHNLARKMCAYFLEHIRSKYLINTINLNTDLVEKIAAKSGYDLNETHKLMQTVITINEAPALSQEQLNKCYLQFQQFYKHTS